MIEFFRDITLRDIAVAAVDVSIVYYVIYRILLIIKGTRAAQMVIGIVLIGAAFFAAERFEMTTVSWLLDNFIESIIIIVIVVFQQDIRRALMRLGQNVSRWGRKHEISHALDEVLAAALHLAKARIGGIVVFEREAALDEFVDHGELVDARVSKELLVSLFVPSRDNELHDGAVIIRNWRIMKAGAVLPLSRSDMASEFGTRHRAALGITEETDAISVVISEERGEVSLCVKGNIARDLEVEHLRTALQKLFYSEKEAADLEEAARAAAEISKAIAAMAADPTEAATRAEEIRATTVRPDATGATRTPRSKRTSTTRAAEESPT